jgi:hypothetical protein
MQFENSSSHTLTYGVCDPTFEVSHRAFVGVAKFNKGLRAQPQAGIEIGARCRWLPPHIPNKRLHSIQARTVRFVTGANLFWLSGPTFRNSLSKLCTLSGLPPSASIRHFRYSSRLNAEQTTIGGTQSCGSRIKAPIRNTSANLNTSPGINGRRRSHGGRESIR